VEYMHISDPTEIRWLQERIEPVRMADSVTHDQKRRIVQKLNASLNQALQDETVRKRITDQGDEPAEYAMELRGLQWRSLHPELLARNYAALSFLSDAGFRYFLPAFLIADLSGDESNADPVFHLTRGVSGPEGRLFDASTLQLVRSTLGPAAVGMFKRAARKFHQIDWRQYSLRRFAAFTQPERLAIIRYLEHQATDEFNAAPVHRALEGYWRPSVAQPSV